MTETPARKGVKGGRNASERGPRSTLLIEFSPTLKLYGSADSLILKDTSRNKSRESYYPTIESALQAAFETMCKRRLAASKVKTVEAAAQIIRQTKAEFEAFMTLERRE